MAADEPQGWEDRGKAGEVMQRRDLRRALRKGEAGGRTFQAYGAAAHFLGNENPRVTRNGEQEAEAL